MFLSGKIWWKWTVKRFSSQINEEGVMLKNSQWSCECATIHSCSDCAVSRLTFFRKRLCHLAEINCSKNIISFFGSNPNMTGPASTFVYLHLVALFCLSAVGKKYFRIFYTTEGEATCLWLFYVVIPLGWILGLFVNITYFHILVVCRHYTNRATTV